MFPFFIFRKSSLIKSCSSSEDLSEYNISWSYVDRCKFYIHLNSLNVRHFGVVAATTLKIMASRSPSMAWPSYWIPKNLPVVSEVDKGTDRDRMVILLAYFLAYFPKMNVGYQITSLSVSVCLSLCVPH
jgi:hypothetical protein